MVQKKALRNQKEYFRAITSEPPSAHLSPLLVLMLARRFSCPPVFEAAYEPREVPEAARDMRGSVIFRPTREDWLRLLGEMIQLTNEAVRRRAASARDASKPLQLEFMADRIDVDDPLFGYMAVTKDKGWLQGFITATTFTTWHRGFRWDSLSPCVDHEPSHDDDNASSPSGSTAVADSGGSGGSASARRRAAAASLARERVVDSDGSLSAELMQEVYAGDPDGEGVVWPRVAEISLLGALGCGRWLVQLLIDGLEVAESPYRFVVLMATHNAIPFYEKMGFVRVGAVLATRVEPLADEDGDEAEGACIGSKKRKRAAAAAAAAKAAEDGTGRVHSQLVEHTCTEGETAASVAAQYGAEGFDVLFVNQRRFPQLHQHAPLRAGTQLQVPRPLSREEVIEQLGAQRQSWHTVTQEATLRRLADVTGVSADELYRLNKGRLDGLQLGATLRVGTRLLTAGVAGYEDDEYCHWSFPDDESPDEPSYMMARKLKPAHAREAGGALAPATTLEQAKRLLVAQRPTVVPVPGRQAVVEAARRRTAARVAAAEAGAAGAGARSAPATAPDLFDKVVRLDAHGSHEKRYQFWYVLTYLPDLQWCHLAPLERRGTFGERPSPSGHVATGRDRWMLVAEDEGGEIDVGAGRCFVVKATPMMKAKDAVDANMEEWDIVEQRGAVVGDEEPARAEMVMGEE